MASPFRILAHRVAAFRWSALSSIGGQIILLIVLVISIVTTLNVITSSVQQRRSGEEFTLSQARAIGQLAAAGSGGGLAFDDRDFLEKSLRGIEHLTTFELIIIKNRQGDTVYTKNYLQAAPELRSRNSLLKSESMRVYFDDAGHAVAIAPVTAPVSTEGGDDQLGEVIVVVNTTEMNANISYSRNSIIAGSSLAALFCIVAAFFVVSRIVRPIQDLSRVAKRVGAGNITQRASSLTGSTAQSEIGILTNAFNDMLDTLEAANEEMQSANVELATLNSNLVVANNQAEERARELAIASERIQQQNLELRDLSLEKDELLGIVAHDLKNPLGAIQSMAELMTSEPYSTEEMRSFAQIIRNSSVKMFELIRNLLDVNAIERGGRTFAKDAIDLAPILLRTLEFYQTRAAVKSITLHFDRTITAAPIIGDRLAVGQVLDNIVSNAVKYSPQGKNIFVRIKGDDQRKGDKIGLTKNKESSSFLRVEVQDEGQGISPDDMKRLFGKFARLSAQPTGGEHSTGLGLSIVKKMVEAMNGNVWCESELGKGATFIVAFPHAIGLTNEEPPAMEQEEMGSEVAE